ncbi:hypothetical protein SMD22_18375 [Brevibacillus halotolerans]|nr:hypothetical protein SMD22_18375 [Brevibacillus halotolerans]
MRGKLSLFFMMLAIFGLMFTNVSYASVKTAPINNIQIPANVKTTAELLNYLFDKGGFKNIKDVRDYMETNKSNILKMDKNIIDYGYTFRLYAEINKPAKNNGPIKLTHDYGNKELKAWVVPVAIMNYNEQPQQISKENFAIVPKNAFNELTGLSLDPEYIMDGTTGKVLGSFSLPSAHEVHLNVVFYVSPATIENKVSLRVYDGKDHTDVNIVKQ